MFNELVHLLTIINIVVFGHLIFTPFYGDAIIGCDSHKSSLFALGRRKAQELLNFIHNRFMIIMEYREVKIHSLFTTYLVQQLRCLLRHKRFTAKLPDKAAEGSSCTVEALVVNISEAFYDKSWLLEELQRQKRIGRQDTTYSWVDPAVYTVKVRDIPLNGKCCSSYQLQSKHKAIAEDVFNLEFQKALTGEAYQRAHTLAKALQT